MIPTAATGIQATTQCNLERKTRLGGGEVADGPLHRLMFVYEGPFILSSFKKLCLYGAYISGHTVQEFR